ncbi:MAG: hypothetical protein ACRCUH_10225 [Shewanella sp.]
MDIATVKSLRTKIEIDLRIEVQALIQEFQTATGVQVSGIDVGLTESITVDGYRKSNVTSCSVALEL